jgi:nitrite reductase/ring-hydroxylating ferredoxin subunit
MGRYRDDPRVLRDLVRPDEVHRDLYIDPEIFELELERLWGNAWLYVGHDSQVPRAGDYVSLDIARQPLLMVRGDDGTVRVLFNRCAHKGARLVSDACGNVGRFLRCPYHSWSYDLDGAVRAIPLRSGYDGTRLGECRAAGGLARPGGIAVHRGFVFARMSDDGPDFADHFGDLLQVLDNVADRSPEGRLEVGGGVLRTVVDANWKIYLENVNDTVHAVSTHESASSAAAAVWSGQPADAPKPMAIEQLLPFRSGYRFFEQMGGRVHRGGHSILGTKFSIHTSYAELPDYDRAMRAAHGDAGAEAILSFSPQNAIFFPGLSVKASPQAIRVIRPLAVDRTLIEAWAFQPVGAPPDLLRRAMTYNRLVFSPMSVVAHDDLHIFATIQQALQAGGNRWVSLHRGHRPGELDGASLEVDGTNEALLRNQYRAWAEAMAPV